MRNKIEVCGIRLDNLSVDEMLQTVQASFGNGKLFSIQYIYSEQLRLAVENQSMKQIIESADLTVIGEPPVAEVFEGCVLTLDEISGFKFTEEILKLLEKQNRTVYWLGENERDYEMFRAYADKHCPGLRTVGAFVTDRNESGTEQIVNDINRVMPDAILCRLSSPYQEELFAKSRPLLNAQLWFSMGSKMSLSSQHVTATSKIKAMIDKTILRRLAASQKKIEEESV